MFRPWIQRPFLYGIKEWAEKIFNKQMSDVRISVENNYMHLKQYWIVQDFQRKLKVEKAVIELQYKHYAIILDFHVCLYVTVKIYEQICVCTPTLEEYVGHQR